MVGSDDNVLLDRTNPPTTSIHQDVDARGQAAARALLDEVAGGPGPRAAYVFRPRLVVRGSTAAPGAQAAGGTAASTCTASAERAPTVAVTVPSSATVTTSPAHVPASRGPDWTSQ